MMPLTALLDSNVVYASDSEKGMDYKCRECDGAMILKKGNIKIHHFAHEAAGCTWGIGEGEEHEYMKKFIADAIGAAVEVKIGINRYDIAKDNFVIECQCNTSITLEEIKQRNENAKANEKKILWVFGIENYGRVIDNNWVKLNSIEMNIVENQPLIYFYDDMMTKHIVIKKHDKNSTYFFCPKFNREKIGIAEFLELFNKEWLGFSKLLKMETYQKAENHGIDIIDDALKVEKALIENARIKADKIIENAMLSQFRKIEEAEGKIEKIKQQEITIKNNLENYKDEIRSAILQELDQQIKAKEAELSELKNKVDKFIPLTDEETYHARTICPSCKQRKAWPWNIEKYQWYCYKCGHFFIKKIDGVLNVLAS